jgi:hypothetical protein
MKLEVNNKPNTQQIGLKAPLFVQPRPTQVQPSFSQPIAEDSLPPRIQGQLARPQIQQALPALRQPLDASMAQPQPPHFPASLVPFPTIYDLLHGNYHATHQEYFPYMRPMQLPLNLNEKETL